MSIVIPCFNGARFLPSAIASVRGQEGVSVDLIVVDDGSTDGSHAVAAAHGARVVRQPNRGVSVARNVGLDHARADIIVFLDADDELLPGAIASGVEQLKAHPEAACVVRRCQLIDVAGRVLPTTYPRIESGNLYREWLLRNFVWTPGAAIFRRAALLAIGGFPIDVGGAADYAVYLRLARDGRARFDPRDAVRYRQHSANMSHDPRMMLAQTLTVLRRERPHVPLEHAAYFSKGRRAWAAFYGEQIFDRIRWDWRAGRRWNMRQLRAALHLLVASPRVFSAHAVKKLARLVRGIPPSPESDRFGHGR